MSLELLKEQLPDLHTATVLTEIGIEKLEDNSISPHEIANFLLMNTASHVYTKDLNKNGKVVQDSMEDYLANKSISSGNLKQALKTPLHYAFSKSEDSEKLQNLKSKNNSFELGTFIHQMILEPSLFNRVVIEPKENLSTKNGTKKLIEFWENKITENGKGFDEKGNELTLLEVNACMAEVTKGLDLDNHNNMKIKYKTLKQISGITPIGEADYLKLKIIKKHIDNYGGGVIHKLLKHAKREVSVYGTDEETGLDLKVRPDALQFAENIGRNAIISVKSTGTESIEHFAYQNAKLHYDLSEGMYQEVVSNVTGRNFDTTIMIMVQTIEPFAVAVVVYDSYDIEVGKYKFRTALQTVKESEEKGVFPGYDSKAEERCFGIISMKLPDWNNRELEPSYIEN